jgi:hypothetical protein
MRHARTLLFAWTLAACGRHPERAAPPAHATPIDMLSIAAPGSALPPLENPFAYIPPDCYVKPQPRAGRAGNSCYPCHVRAEAPNFVSDPELQLAYSLPAPARQNPYRNLLRDRSADAAALSDAEVLSYVREDNYPLDDRSIALTTEFVDAAFHFDERGFDRDPSGAPTGWWSFAYHPLPGRFTPEAGTFGDVLLRLPAEFRENAAGALDLDIYALNLAIVRALIRREDVRIPETDERAIAFDLDGDEELGSATRVSYRFTPDGPKLLYVGRAALELAAGRQRLAPGLYPRGTEFLHSLRYADVRDGRVVPAPRMKELRYARKARFLSYAELRELALHELGEDGANPDRPRRVLGDSERGVANGTGWVYQGLIEDRRGSLRRQSYEELVACVGCHGGTGATTDSSFALPRAVLDFGAAPKVVHQLDLDFGRLPDPARSDHEREYGFYAAMTNGAPDPRRARPRTVAPPEPAVALLRNKLYLTIVREQSYRFGRDRLGFPPVDLFETVPDGELTGVARPIEAGRLEVRKTALAWVRAFRR